MRGKAGNPLERPGWMGEDAVALCCPLLVAGAHCSPPRYGTATAKTLTTQYMVRLSHLTVQLPSTAVSQ